MSEGIVIALIGGAVSIFSVFLTAFLTGRKSDMNMKISQAITDTKIEELTREVHLHNNYARRVPVLEEQMRVVNHRIADLEKAEET